MKKFLIAFLVGLGLGISGLALAVNVTVPQSTIKGSIPVGNANGTYNNGNLAAGTNITISTSTTGEILISATGGSGNSAWTLGSGLIYNATSTDSVLIGTSTPTTGKLIIQGSGAKNLLEISSSTGASLLTVLANGNVSVGTQTSSGVAVPSTLSLGGTFNSATNGTNSAAKLKLYDDAVSFDGISISSVGGGFTQMEYLTHAGVDHAWYVAGSEKMRILSSNGNVGIGYSVPGTLLHLGINDASGNGIKFSRTDNSWPTIIEALEAGGAAGSIHLRPSASSGALLTTGLYIQTVTGNVGVGTTTPTDNLQVFGDAATMGLNHNTTASYNQMVFRQGGVGQGFLSYLGTTFGGARQNTFEMYSNTGVDMTFLPAGTERMRILSSNGNVGIGLAAPAASLHIQGTGTTNLFQINSSTGVTLLAMTPNGSVGIGTSTPIATLTVMGTTTLPGMDVFNVATSSSVTASSSLFIVKNNGNVGIASATPTSYLSIGDGFGTTVAQGITFGGTSNLYRSGVATIMTDAATLRVSGGTLTTTGYVCQTGSGCTFSGNHANTTAGSNVIITRNVAAVTTSGTVHVLQVTGGTFTPASGSGIFNSFDIQNGINQCAACTGITRGQLIDSTITRGTDYRALETAAFTFNTNAVSPRTLYHVLFGAVTLASTTPSSTTNISTLSLAYPTATGNYLISSSTALTIPTGTASATNAQGLFVVAPTGGTNNYAALFMGGNVGIGTTSPAQTLTVVGSGIINPFTVSSSTSTSLFQVGADGRVGIASTTPQFTLSVVGTMGVVGLTGSGVGDTYICISTAGELRTGATCAASIREVKEDITDFTDEQALRILSQLQVFNYKYKDAYYGGKESIGPMAEDVFEIDPRLAILDEAGKPIDVNFRAIDGVLITAMQAQQKQIENLRGEKGFNFSYLSLLGLLGLIPLIRRKND